MSLVFDLSPQAVWRAILHGRRLVWVQYATQAPQRALACIQQAGIAQLFAWDVQQGTLRPLTDFSRDTLQAAISADGEQVYYHYDAQGGQVGHIFRRRWDGQGTPEDLTPSLPAYISFYINECYSGRLLGFMAVNQDGVQMFALDAQQGGTPHLRYEGEAFALGPFLSYDGEVTVIATTEYAAEGMYHYSLESYHTLEGRKLHILTDRDASIIPLGFVPRAHDMRFLALHQGRPLWWNARTGESHALNSPLEGEVTPLDWSSDAQTLLVRQHADTPDERLYRVDWATGTPQPLLQAPQGRYERASFAPDQWLYAEYQSAETPPCVVALDAHTGALQRSLLVLNSAEEIPTTTSTHHAKLIWLTDAPSNAYQPLIHALRVAGLDVHTLNQAQWQAQASSLGDLPCFIMGMAWHASEALVALAHQPHLAGAIAVDGIADWADYYAKSDSSVKIRLEDYFGGTPEQVPQRYNSASPMHSVAQLSVSPLLLFAHSPDALNPELDDTDGITSDPLSPYWQALAARGLPVWRYAYDPQMPSHHLHTQLIERILVYCSERLSRL